MADLAVKTPKPSSTVHKNRGADSDKNSANNSPFIQPRESENSFFSQGDFIQPSLTTQVDKKEDTQNTSEEVETTETEVAETSSEKQVDSDKNGGEASNGIKKGIFGEPAFIQPRVQLNDAGAQNASAQKEEVESGNKGPSETTSDAKEVTSNDSEGAKTPVSFGAKPVQDKTESSEGEEGQKEEGEPQDQASNEKVEDLPNDAEPTDVSPEQLAADAANQEGQKDAAAKEGGEPKKGPKKRGKNAAFKNVIEKVKGTSKEQKQHDPPEQLSGEAQGSALAPVNERSSQAQASVVDGMDAEAKEPKEFKAEEFKAKLMKRINSMDLPENLEEADDFKGDNKLDDVNKAALGDVQQEKQATVGNIDQATNQQPNADAVPAKEVTPLRPVPVGDKPKSVNADKAVPSKRPDSEVKQPVEENTQRLDDTMAENEVTDEQLAISEEPQFEKTLESKGTAKENAKTGPAKLRQQEQATLDANAQKAEGTSQEKLQAMNMLRGTAINKVVGGQKDTAGKDTSERQRIATEINTIYENTKKDVNKILGDLDKEVSDLFKAASDKAKKAFENYCDRKMRAYKRKRYSGVIGKGRWLKDKLFSLPDEVNQFYVDGKQRFKDVMEAEITKIADLVARKLNLAKQRVETGKQEVTDYVNALPENLKSIGKDAADDLQDKFDELSDSVDSAQDDLVDKLATEYQASLDEVNARIEEMKEANKGLVDKAMDMVKGVIETIKKLKQVISNLLSAISHVVPIIIASPIKFMGDLFAGIGKGIDMFKANIQKHLMGGLLEWLTGSLGPLGIQMPNDIFSLKGIFSLVMQVLGLGWDYLRLKAVKMLGEPVVTALEGGWDMFKKFSKDGVMGMWEYMKDKFGDLKETVMGAIKDMLITKVIEAGIKWLLSLLIPGAGFIKAVMAIKDVIVFFVESAIMLIPAITEAILALASGSLAGVGKAIEFGLSKLIVLVIGLFAKLIGLGGLSKKVQKIFKKLRKRVNRAINKLLTKARKAGRKLMRKLGIGKKKKKGKKDKTDKKEDEKDVAAARKDVKKLMSQKSLKPKKLRSYLKKIKKKRGLKKLELKKVSKTKHKIVGKINPEFEEFGTTIELRDPEEPGEEVMTFFRTIGPTELKAIISSGGKLAAKPKKKKKKRKAGVAGEFVITQNEEYSRDVLMIERQLTSSGELPKGVKKVEDLKYSILIRFDVRKSVMDQIREERGRRARGQEGHNMDLEEDAEGLRNVAVYKLKEIGIEGAPAGNINIVFKSDPDLGDADVLALLNQGIVNMEITGSFIPRRKIKREFGL